MKEKHVADKVRTACEQIYTASPWPVMFCSAILMLSKYLHHPMQFKAYMEKEMPDNQVGLRKDWGICDIVDTC